MVRSPGICADCTAFCTSPPREVALLDTPIVAEKPRAGGAGVAFLRGGGVEDQQVGEAGAAGEIGQAIGRAQPAQTGAGDGAARGEVAAGARTHKEAGKVVALKFALANLDR